MASISPGRACLAPWSKISIWRCVIHSNTSDCVIRHPADLFGSEPAECPATSSVRGCFRAQQDVDQGRHARERIPVPFRHLGELFLDLCRHGLRLQSMGNVAEQRAMTNDFRASLGADPTDFNPICAIEIVRRLRSKIEQRLLRVVVCSWGLIWLPAIPFNAARNCCRAKGTSLMEATTWLIYRGNQRRGLYQRIIGPLQKRLSLTLAAEDVAGMTIGRLSNA